MPVAVHRMRGQVKAEGILFLRHSLRQRPGADRRQPYRRKPRPAVSEQGVLPALALIGGGGRMAHDGFGRGMDTGPVGRDAIERARARQAFKLPLVELARIDPPGEIVKARSEEHTSELQSLMRISYAVFCLKKKNTTA